MLTAPFLQRTGQGWKPQLGFLLQALGLLGVYATLREWWGVLPAGSAMLIVLSSLAISIVGFVGEIAFIRCPKCKAKLFWHAVNAKDHPSGLNWFFGFVACPTCGFEPADPK